MNSHTNKKWTVKRKENANNNKSKHYNGEWKKNVSIVLKDTQGKDPGRPYIKVMKQKNLHEGCIEQMRRLALDHLADGKSPEVDDQRLIRLDNLELGEDVQNEVADLWDKVDTDNLNEISDFVGFRKEFSELFGFQVEGIDYDEPLETEVRL